MSRPGIAPKPTQGIVPTPQWARQLRVAGLYGIIFKVNKKGKLHS
jgi:hypothetical protein